MGQKKQKGSVSLENANGRIRLRWRFQSKRYSLNLCSYSKENKLEARKLALIIERDMLCRTFDLTLEKYSQKHQERQSAVKQDIVSLFETWVVDYKQLSCEINIDYHQVRNLLKRWDKKVIEHTVLGLLNREEVSAKTYNIRLSILSKFSKWLVKNKVWSSNPLSEVAKRKAKKLDRKDRKPFTIEEIKLLLDAVKTNRFSNSNRFPHSHYYPFLYFLCQTGCRNAEAIGLRASAIDLDNNIICISEVLARSVRGTNSAARVRKETKNGKVRYLPLTEDLKAVLYPLVINKDKDELVFTSFTGVSVDDRMLQRRVFKPILKELGIQERVLYACRHTFASRCIETGISPVTVAFMLGNNPETALRNYTHQISLPSDLPKI